jgi:hypothetical protein
VSTETVADIESRIERARRSFGELKAEMARAIVGHEALIEQVFIALVCGGHCARQCKRDQDRPQCKGGVKCGADLSHCLVGLTVAALALQRTATAG